MIKIRYNYFIIFDVAFVISNTSMQIPVSVSIVYTRAFGAIYFIHNVVSILSLRNFSKIEIFACST